MIEKNCYESKLQLGGHEYDLPNLEPSLLEYFKDNTRLILPCEHKYDEEDIGFRYKSWVFLTDATCVHMQTIKTSNDNYHFIDVKLVSEVTPTDKLEGKLRDIVEPFKIKIIKRYPENI